MDSILLHINIPMPEPRSLTLPIDCTELNIKLASMERAIANAHILIENLQADFDRLAGGST